jgi:hypothetical protein
MAAHGGLFPEGPGEGSISALPSGASLELRAEPSAADAGAPSQGPLDAPCSLRALTTESLANLEALDGLDLSEDELSHELSHNSEPWDVPSGSGGSALAAAGARHAHAQSQQPHPHIRPHNPHATTTSTLRE